MKKGRPLSFPAHARYLVPRGQQTHEFRLWFFRMVPGTVWLLTVLLFSSPLARAARPSLDLILHRIEEQRYTWYGFTSAVKLNFKTSMGQIASCTGTLDYQRLNEKLLLSCYTAPDALAFILKTDDDRFSLYLPAQNTLYEGNIFDLEFSEKVDSHIQPMDLYRALKAMPILRETANLESSEGGTTVVGITDLYKGEPFLARRLTADENGNVPEETYLDHTGAAILEIERHDFQKVKGPSMSREIKTILMPRHIFFRNDRQNTETEIYFTDIKPVQDDHRSWRLPLPRGTQVVELPKMKDESEPPAQLPSPVD